MKTLRWALVLAIVALIVMSSFIHEPITTISKSNKQSNEQETKTSIIVDSARALLNSYECFITGFIYRTAVWIEEGGLDYAQKKVSSEGLGEQVAVMTRSTKIMLGDYCDRLDTLKATKKSQLVKGWHDLKFLMPYATCFDQKTAHFFLVETAWQFLQSLRQRKAPAPIKPRRKIDV